MIVWAQSPMETVGQRQFGPRRPAASKVLSVADVRGVPHPPGGWPVAWAIEGLLDTAYRNMEVHRGN